MNEQDKKIAIVTGASRGIGAEIARRLSKDGFTVVVNYSGSEAAAQTVVSEILAQGGSALAVKADVSNSTEVSALFDKVEASYGGADILVNTAGVMELAPLVNVEDHSIERQIDINLKGTIYALREASARLRDGGRIINFSTTVVGLKLENYGVYAATKAAVETLTGIMAKEMRGRKINVNSVAPGPTATELFLKGKPDELIERMAKMNPLERLGKPEDIASVVAFLAGPDSGWINGQVLRANGGLI
ncbi:SDR family oxidoreductase [Shewanella ulleungensis]|uniref:3-ketoacyl-ACP reductase n=1 Tax=Shewanella ulleungensis TaxID=2282699 RepID=A0ABQ2QCA3_9GAMM|nr:SDR family oxidoreductase [Shewanella ulleungensis]MCL1148870.1 SDR family oxidoreductase [Shewanella ulleungensis]GGP75098.1 3-ketoacyl-ACP reductase [Shewanella ulleungensis]